MRFGENARAAGFLRDRGVQFTRPTDQEKNMNHQGPQIPEDVNDSNLYRAYRLLLSVCETGVLSRACDRTGLSLPTASRLLARARTWFDDPLFVHSAGRMYPTVRMKALRPRLIEAMRATRTLQRGERVRPAERRGRREDRGDRQRVLHAAHSAHHGAPQGGARHSLSRLRPIPRDDVGVEARRP